jgi:hypothetical protein
VQAITISISKDNHNGRSKWVKACMDVEALVRRFGFDIWACSAGSSMLDVRVNAYHVMGERSEPLGPPDGAIDPFDAIRREVGELKHVYSLESARVTFGAVDMI